jgi:hypothetical protein
MIASADLGQPVTISATVISTGGGTATPTGKVYFYRAGNIQIGTGTLSGYGNTSIIDSTLPLGVSNITALYLGDMNYQPSYASAQSVTIYNGPGDFSLTVPTSCTTTVTVVHGQSAIYCLSVTSVNGFDQTVSFTCSNLPPESTCLFAPSALTPAIGAPASLYGLSISTTPPADQNGPHTEVLGGPRLRRLLNLSPLLAILLWLPGLRLRGCRRLRSQLLSLTVCLLTLGTLIGCDSLPSAAPTTPPGTYSITINASASTGTHTMTVTMIVK